MINTRSVCHLPSERVEEGVASLLVDDRQETFLSLCCDYTRSESHSEAQFDQITHSQSKLVSH
jgi:hypothetical protein